MRLKNMWRKGEGDERGDVVNRSDLIAELRQRIDALGSRDALLTQ